ncbi:hypothetical protein DFP73DRAFT_529956 [Morchella snyderi]|nr:hypothetical protein DFP73DRAFT_529956 [Morchella snyderi]
MADPPKQPPRSRSTSPADVTKNRAPLLMRQTQLGYVIIDPDRWYGPSKSASVGQAPRRPSPPAVNSNTTIPLLANTRPPEQTSRRHPEFSLTALDPDVNERRSSTGSISSILPVRPTPRGPAPPGEASTHTRQRAVSGTTLATLQSPGSGGTLVPPPNIGSGTSSTPGPSFPSAQTVGQSSTNQPNAPNIQQTRSELIRYYISEGRAIPQEVLNMPDPEPRVRRRDWFFKKCRGFKEWCRRLGRKD